MLTIDVLYKGLAESVSIMKPILIPIIVSAIAICIIKFIARKLTYNFAILSGDNKRTARKKANTASDIIDLVSSINDVHKSKQ